MIIASIGGSTAIGFAEAVKVNDGRVERRGMVKLARAPSPELLDLLDRGRALVYSGPVWADGRWRHDTFLVHAAEASEASDGSMALHFIETQPVVVASSL